jgi:hypothetical protein
MAVRILVKLLKLCRTVFVNLSGTAGGGGGGAAPPPASSQTLWSGGKKRN